MTHTDPIPAAEDREAIRIIVREMFAIVPATVADLVIRALSPRKRGSDQRHRGVRFYVCDRHGRLRLPVRLLPRIQQHLERHGFQVVVQDRRHPGSRPVVGEGALEPATNSLIETVQRVVAEQIKASLVPGGAIAIQSPRDAADIAATIARLAPEVKVLIVVKNGQAAQTLARRIASQVPVPVTCNGDFQWRDGPQIHVDNMQSMVGRSVEDWRIVIIADLESARAKTVIDQVQCMTQSCVFAILPAAANHDAEDQLRLEMLCGPEIFRQRDDASMLTAVEVAWLHPAVYPAAQPKDPLERKRLYFWNNPRRNQPIAAAARAAREMDLPKQRQLGIHEAQALQAAARDGKKPRVCILVESPEHASILGELLPDWERIRAENDRDKVSALPLMPDQAIVTIPGAYSQGLAADVVIRAAGTEQFWKPAYGPHPLQNGSHLLVIDVEDDVDQWAQLDAQKRLRDYHQRGWLSGVAPYFQGVSSKQRHQDTIPLEGQERRRGMKQES